MPRCQNVFLSPLVGLDIFLVGLARTEVSSEETFLPSTKDQPSESRAMRDRYPLVHVCVGVHRVTDLEQFRFESPRMKLPSTAIFREGVKGKQRPFGLQLCASHGRTFAWHFRCGPTDGENAPHSPFASVVCL